MIPIIILYRAADSILRMLCFATHIVYISDPPAQKRPRLDHRKKNRTSIQSAIKLASIIPSLLLFAPILLINPLIPGT